MPNEEVVDFQCPKCGKRLKAGAAFAGRRVKCPKCQQPVNVPGERPSSAAPGPAPATRPPKTAEKPPATEPTPPVGSTAPTPPLASVPVANADDDWLNLGGPAIADLAARQQAVEENKLSKERERTARKNKEQQRQRANPGVTAESLELASQRRLRGQSPLPASKHAAAEEAADDLPGLAPLTTGTPASARTPAQTAADREAAVKRSVFDDDLPELAELQSPMKAKSAADKLLATHAGIDLADLDNLSALVPDLGATPPRRVNSTGRPAGKSTGHGGGLPALFDDGQTNSSGPQNKDPEYRIECKACGTAQHVRLSTQGKKIKCPDCFLEFKIPPPPPGWSSKKKAKLQLTGEDIPLSAAEELHHAQTLESQRSRTAQLLHKAQQQVSDEDLDRLYDGDFDTAGFVQRTFGFFKDPIALAHLVGYGIVFALVFAAGQFAANNMETRVGRTMLLMTVIGAPLIGILFAMPMLSGGLALLESVANRQKRVAEWPGFNLFENAGDIAAISIALLGALIPGFLIGSWLGGEGEGAGRIQIAGMMVTTFALFPVFLLSMLDNGSVFAPLSSSIFQSFSAATEDWGAYYLKTLIAFSGTMLLWLLLLGKHEVLAAAAGFLLPLLVLFTCQQIGALADAIGEHLSFEWVPPEKDGEGEGHKDNGSRKQQVTQP